MNGFARVFIVSLSNNKLLSPRARSVVAILYKLSSTDDESFESEFNSTPFLNKTSRFFLEFLSVIFKSVVYFFCSSFETNSALKLGAVWIDCGIVFIGLEVKLTPVKLLSCFFVLISEFCMQTIVL